jgi:phage gp36-like protein
MAAYATRDDLEAAGLSPEVVTAFDSDDVTAALVGASVFADGYLRARATVPVAATGSPPAYPSDLVRAVAKIAAYELLAVRGYDPNTDPNPRMRYEDALRWLEGVRDGDILPSWAASTEGARGSDGAFVLQPSYDAATNTTAVSSTPTPRGW